MITFLLVWVLYGEMYYKETESRFSLNVLLYWKCIIGGANGEWELMIDQLSKLVSFYNVLSSLYAPVLYPDSFNNIYVYNVSLFKFLLV